MQARFPAARRKPRVVFVDRGKGFFNTRTGRIVPAFKDALDAAGLEAFWGDSAAARPGQLQEVMLHETAVAWFRKRMRAERPVRAPWDETLGEWSRRARRAVSYVNANYDVAGLCKGFPERLQALAEAEGERLRK